MTLPMAGLTGSAAASTAPTETDPDQLFWEGRFAEADRGYAALLRGNPDDAHALARRGCVALLSNRFGSAESFLTRALELAPDDAFSVRQLVDCYVRQDQYARAVPLLGDAPTAVQYGALTGTPFEIRGPEATRIPFLTLDPLPQIPVSLNGGTPKTFHVDTGGSFGLSAETAEEAGLEAVATGQATLGGRVVTTYLGAVDSVRLGEIELRNVPVAWHDTGAGEDAGVIGTAIFYHFLTTLDYAHQGLVLRRKTGAQVREVQAAAERAGTRPQPLWLADGHFPFTLGSLGGYGPRVVEIDTGVPDFGVTTTEEKARKAGVAIDYDHPVSFLGVTGYSITPDTVSIGDAVREDVPGVVAPVSLDERLGFEILANVTHQFLKPFSCTFDYAGMRLYLTGGQG
ncbi:pepsin/retropepsin-like aspartic protease family protein [Streptomyces hoynatensis]|uniref:pepsin/retropepsin-like aspartic protease family protein n=1 Tax=Streptomyces hoynatensis TaxID=1141874 RepID=UPI0019D41244|nr:pepsin/retropepsin-like aspartic protease family protein [Streptomyces hoynatensis]